MDILMTENHINFSLCIGHQRSGLFEELSRVFDMSIRESLDLRYSWVIGVNLVLFFSSLSLEELKLASRPEN
jgi:hypothetical protein